MPYGMRFCRLCGFRLGEGVEEYTETVRLGGQARGQAATASAGHSQANAPFGVHDWGAMAPTHDSQIAQGKKKRKGKGPHWIVWVILAVVLASVAGGSFMFPFRMNIGGSRGSGASAQVSKVGASGFTTIDGGVMIDSAAPPDGPIDKAGIIGGDVVTSFDGQIITSDDQLRRQIGATPIGKTVEVLFTRDGEAKKTTLTTVSEDELDRLTDIAEGIPDGFLGVDDLDRVQVPNTNLFGVRLGQVSRNRPAYISGLREGDILVEYNGTPIRTPQELGARIDRSTPDSKVKAVVMRDGVRTEIDIVVGIDD
jgi:S1-C subfamily serine protease